MLIKDFQTASAGFDFDAPTKGKLWFYALGLCGEAAELMAKASAPVRDSSVSYGRSVALECGDVLWYVAALANLQGVSLADDHAPVYQHLDLSVRDVVRYCGEVAELVKKHYRDGAELSPSSLKIKLDAVVRYVGGVAQHWCFTVGDVADLNVEKLESRRRRGTSRGSGDDR